MIKKESCPIKMLHYPLGKAISIMLRSFVLLLLVSTTSFALDSLNVSRIGSYLETWDKISDVNVVDNSAYLAANASGLLRLTIQEEAEQP